MCDSVYADSSKIQNPNNGHWYQRTDTLKTWHEAKAYCKSVEGYLATVTSQSEMDFILNTFGDANHTWIGGTDEEQEGVWKWVTGETWGYASWNSGQPDNEGGMGD